MLWIKTTVYLAVAFTFPIALDTEHTGSSLLTPTPQVNAMPMAVLGSSGGLFGGEVPPSKLHWW